MSLWEYREWSENNLKFTKNKAKEIVWKISFKILLLVIELAQMSHLDKNEKKNY